jgi:hypothetical protein
MQCQLILKKNRLNDLLESVNEIISCVVITQYPNETDFINYIHYLKNEG